MEQVGRETEGEVQVFFVFIENSHQLNLCV